MSDEDLRINTLHRFAKHSPRLTLQEYSHCEVPAGCGGVVLRWVDPEGGPIARIRGVSLGTADTWLDGAALTTDRARLNDGRHVLVFHLKGLDRARVPIAISIAGDLGPNRRATNRLGEATSCVERWMPGPLAEAVAAPDFDDRNWRTPVRATARTFEGLVDHMRGFFERCVNEGMTVLELDSGGPAMTDAWVRVSFVLPLGLLTEEERRTR